MAHTEPALDIPKTQANKTLQRNYFTSHQRNSNTRGLFLKYICAHMHAILLLICRIETWINFRDIIKAATFGKQFLKVKCSV